VWFIRLLRCEGAAALPHPFSAARLRRSASFHRLTGVSVATFDQMLARLRGPWEAAARRKAKPGRPWGIGGLEDHLLVLLLYYRCYVTQEFLGFFYRVDRSVICRAIRRVEAPVKPLFALRREPRVSAAEAEALLIDCTERAADPTAEGPGRPAGALLGQEEAPHREDGVYRHRQGAHRQRLALPSR
jgi:Helix-turn-helix of DDE superfamily endonuclease